MSHPACCPISFLTCIAITLGRVAAAKLYATIDRVPKINSADPSGLKPEKVVGEITIEDVKFNYPSRPDVPVVKGVNITFIAGQTAALVGASGSGKSTVISLIERFYDPLSGSVRFDGVDIRNLNIKWLRSQIGLVSQEPTLFATTIKDNVAHGLINTPYEHASEEEKFQLVKEACIKANADGFVTKLPNGYDTMVGERGFLLSGGQKQRIAIARAIVSDPRILLLDEATSALDTQSEGIVQNALDKVAAGRTTITIAHRLSTIKDADCIYVMGEGLVLEKGTHMELLADEDSAYSRLVQAQKLRENKEMNNTASSAAEVNMEQTAGKPPSLDRKAISHSIASDIARKRSREKKKKGVGETKYGMPYLFVRIGKLHRGELWRYVIGTVFAVGEFALSYTRRLKNERLRQRREWPTQRSALFLASFFCLDSRLMIIPIMIRSLHFWFFRTRLFCPTNRREQERIVVRKALCYVEASKLGPGSSSLLSFQRSPSVSRVISLHRRLISCRLNCVR